MTEGPGQGAQVPTLCHCPLWATTFSEAFCSSQVLFNEILNELELEEGWQSRDFSKAAALIQLNANCHDQGWAECEICLINRSLWHSSSRVEGFLQVSCTQSPSQGSKGGSNDVGTEAQAINDPPSAQSRNWFLPEVLHNREWTGVSSSHLGLLWQTQSHTI